MIPACSCETWLNVDVFQDAFVNGRAKGKKVWVTEVRSAGLWPLDQEFYRTDDSMCISGLVSIMRRGTPSSALPKTRYRSWTRRSRP